MHSRQIVRQVYPRYVPVGLVPEPGWGWFAEPAPAPMVRRCSVGPSTTMIRCATRQQCPAIPDLLCVRGAGGVPFEYVKGVRRDRATGLAAVTDRIPNREQRFTPPAHMALTRFVGLMALFRMPIAAILTMGSLYCRCISRTNRLSNHSFGDAIDIAGVRWQQPSAAPSRTPETIMHNWRDPEQRQALRRINACLRLSFATVIDYHNADHRDHFHADTNRGRGRIIRGKSTIVFVQEALGQVLGRPVPSTGRLDAATLQALREFLGLPAGAPLPRDLGQAFNVLFIRIARGPATPSIVT
jgi:hypothetical protein